MADALCFILSAISARRALARRDNGQVIRERFRPLVEPVVLGVLVGALSWLLALPLSTSGAFALSGVVREAIVLIPLDFPYSASGAVLWLLIVVLLSALASLFPALRATRVSVRESLAYE